MTKLLILILTIVFSRIHQARMDVLKRNIHARIVINHLNVGTLWFGISTHTLMEERKLTRHTDIHAPYLRIAMDLTCQKDHY